MQHAHTFQRWYKLWLTKNTTRGKPPHKASNKIQQNQAQVSTYDRKWKTSAPYYSSVTSTSNINIDQLQLEMRRRENRFQNGTLQQIFAVVDNNKFREQ